LHGGTVEAHSDGENRGSNFVVTIPCPEELVILQAGDSNTGVSERASLKDLNILVVDDDIDSREVISTALSLHGAEVRTAASVLEALVTLNEWKPGLLLSDIGMPGQDGYDLIRQVRESGAEYSRIPAIAVTGYADFREAERALAAGYQMHLPKPIEPVALVEIVTNLARAHGQIYAVEKE
jgi:CheY-like chemotaxis protein